MSIRYKLSGAPLSYTLALVEGAADPYQSFGSSLWSDDKKVSPQLKELVFMRCSIVNRCLTCLSSHIVSARRRGLSDAEIEAVEHPERWSEVFDQVSVLVLKLADAICGDSWALPEELVNDLRRHFDEVELAELTMVCGQANLNNRIGNAAKQLLG